MYRYIAMPVCFSKMLNIFTLVSSCLLGRKTSMWRERGTSQTNKNVLWYNEKTICIL